MKRTGHGEQDDISGVIEVNEADRIAEHMRLEAEYGDDAEYEYEGLTGNCQRCRNVGPLFRIPETEVDQFLCAECVWEFGWTVNAPDPLSYWQRGT